MRRTLFGICTFLGLVSCTGSSSVSSTGAEPTSASASATAAPDCTSKDDCTVISIDQTDCCAECERRAITRIEDERRRDACKDKTPKDCPVLDCDRDDRVVACVSGRCAMIAPSASAR